MIAINVNTFTNFDAKLCSYKSKPTSIGHKNVKMQCNGIKYGTSIMPRRTYSVTAKGTISHLQCPIRVGFLCTKKELPKNKE